MYGAMQGSGRDYDGPSQAPPMPRVTLVAEHMLTLEKQAHDLRELATAIEQRFHAVLRPMGPSPAEKQPSKDAATPFVGALSSISDTLAVAQRALHSVLERCEL